MISRQLTKPSGSLSIFLLVIPLFITFNTFLFSATPLFAKTWYVKPSSEVVIRSGQGNNYKITAMVKNGVSVELLEENESYAKVRLVDGKEGWMLKRFLSTDTPLEEVVMSLRTEKEKIEQNASDLAQKLKEVSATLAEKEQITTKYQTLQRDTADVVQTNEDLLQATKENESLIKELTSIKEENNSLKKNNTIKWFLAGGSVLLLGILLGKISGQSRRKKSLL